MDAAVDGDRASARELITEAVEVTGRVSGNANHRFTAFNATGVALYQVSIAQVLGDNGTAIEHARTVAPGAIPTAERRGRYRGAAQCSGLQDSVGELGISSLITL